MDPQTSTAVDEGLPDLQGLEGVSLTSLRPAGTVRINGKRMDVVTTGNSSTRTRKFK